MSKPIQDILNYSVPIVNGNGDCVGSDCFGAFNAEEYLPFVLDEERTAQILALDSLMEELFDMDGVDWCGVYLSIPEQEHNELYHPALLKISYRGEMSRGLFPLTEAFAKNSNNSTVALSGEAITVNDVQGYVSSGGCYYECDARVQSEYCHPLFDTEGKVIGIVDIESFQKQSFTDEDFMKDVMEMMSRVEEGLRQLKVD